MLYLLRYRVLISIELIANHMYGPSCSMESALRYYGMIPEKPTVIQ